MADPLIELWTSLALRLGIGPAAEPLREELFARYLESHRAYHNLDHLRFCFRELAKMREKISPVPPISPALDLALWYHDVIYDPHARDNEEQSARFFRGQTGNFPWQQTFSNRVEELILVTRTHQPGEDFESGLIADVDLAILGAEKEFFAAYETRIRSEYSWVSEEAWRRGRSEVLTRFLQRPRLYSTDYFWECYEEKARENLREALKRLA